MSNIMQKVKDAVNPNTTSTTTTTGTAGQGNDPRSTNLGPHSTNVGNAMDPRVDSDGDRTRTSGIGGTHGAHGNDPRSTNHGPHSTNIANKADPRVDSDLDRGTGIGSSTHTGTTGMTGHSAGMGNNLQSTNYGPHSSNLMNKADPRVDSDRDRGTTTHTGATTGLTSGGVGNNPQSTNHGPHSSNLMNKADPRVDSDRDRTTGQAHLGGSSHVAGAGVGSTTAGSGNATKTSGPHNSNLLNKLDPRVDSDLDGSKTMGANKTFT